MYSGLFSINGKTFMAFLISLTIFMFLKFCRNANKNDTMLSYYIFDALILSLSLYIYVFKDVAFRAFLNKDNKYQNVNFTVVCNLL